MSYSKSGVFTVADMTRKSGAGNISHSSYSSTQILSKTDN